MRDEENPLNEVKRIAYVEGMKMLLTELIGSANSVGAETVTVESLQRKLESML
jgi:hypothetical protein